MMSQIPTPPVSPGPVEQGEVKPSGMATASLILGILGLLTACVGVGLVLGLLALIFGLLALGQINNPTYRVSGSGKARAGAIMGGIALGLALLIIPVYILLPALGAARRTARQMQSNTQVRGIGQGMVMFAGTNNTYYPGLDNVGDIIRDDDLGGTVAIGGHPNAVRFNGGHPAARYALLLERNYFNPSYMVSPVEAKTIWQGPSSPITTNHYSYAMLRIAESNDSTNLMDGKLPMEWRETINSFAAVISDRNTGKGRGNNINGAGSIHTEPDSGDWRGSVGYNDNHVEFSTSHILFGTQYGGGLQNNEDNLFFDEPTQTSPVQAEQGANAQMVYKDETSLVDHDN